MTLEDILQIAMLRARRIRVGCEPPEHVLRNRHTKTAKGMTRTAYRSGHKLSPDASRLSVRGTTALVLYSLTYRVRRKTCHCCGHVTGKFELNDSGRQRLARARTRALLRKDQGGQ